ncbi:FtsX-like permease family protein [Calidifontibacter sp. DB0510]|uniref:FtsX-like permease family protein n=1 Tax=Metallococcus carri TaxID=1656884 RepID=A0A967AZE7_9MICO|nr:ABC transporter permease [Metallococcus carri]NHN54635.1 FtsX-like permease family protein [Metallococcus carri]NOP36526.1 FtsX-like permease family protein [Calidifontibacter sp. DB2511S]
MLRATWRSLIARRMRLLMSTFAIVLGVAFVAGSLVFTDTLDRAFTGIVSGTVGDVMVRPQGAQASTRAGTTATVPVSLVARVKQVPGVRDAVGEARSPTVYVLDKRGKPLGGQGAPGFAMGYHTLPAAHGIPALTLTAGRPPTRAGEVTIDPATAGAAAYRIGDTVSLLTAGTPPRITARIVGFAKFGQGSLVGATLTTFDPATAQRLFVGNSRGYQDIWVTAQPGVSDTELRSRIAAVLPRGVQADTGDAVAKESGGQIKQALGFITTFLLIFAGISLLVGGFLIVNTFSMLVAQRSRELALLRALGARRGQVTRSVLAEALVVGLVGSTVGLGLGFLLAIGIRALFARFGLDLSGTPLVFRARTVLAAYGIGMVVTAIAAYLPARRASSIPPVAALRDDIALPERAVWRRWHLGMILLGGAAGALIKASIRPVQHSTYVLAVGMIAALFAVILISPVVARPVLRAAGVPYRWIFGAVGRLAEENSLRNPRRTAATASALMIGMTLVSMMTVFGASAKSSVDALIADNFTGDYVVSSQTGIPFSPSLADSMAKVPGVQEVSRLRYSPAQIGTDKDALAGIEPRTFGDIVKIELVAGRMPAVKGHTLLVQDDVAAQRRLGVGSKVPVSLGGRPATFTVIGIFKKSPAILVRYLTSLEGYAAAGGRPQDTFVYVIQRGGADPAAVERRLQQIVAPVPTVTVKNQQEFAAQQHEQIDTLLRIIYALLGLAVIIAVLGIVNTLALSVIERTREIGLLRAVGLSRRQLRRMVRLEAVVVSLLGAVLGVALGVALGYALQRSQRDQGITVLAVPWTQLGLYVVLAALVGVLAAWLPARRAARLDVLRAIATE